MRAIYVATKFTPILVVSTPAIAGFFYLIAIDCIPAFLFLSPSLASLRFSSLAPSIPQQKRTSGARRLAKGDYGSWGSDAPATVSKHVYSELNSQ